jgi:hypothetical protein
MSTSPLGQGIEIPSVLTAAAVTTPFLSFAAELARITDSSPGEPVPPTTCPWCPDFNARLDIHRGVSHTACAPCLVLLEQRTA